MPLRLFFSITLAASIQYMGRFLFFVVVCCFGEGGGGGGDTCPMGH